MRMTAIKKNLQHFFWVIASHIPCCGPLVASAVLGIHIIPSHNPYVEWLLAILAPAFGLTLHNWFHERAENKDHHHHEHNHHGHTCPAQKNVKEIVWSYIFWIGLSCAIMAAHQFVLGH
ncbi:MAG: hypothetical protein GC136_01325 [Alphaproteobacteria bacterium]|nr:hypothetical protein [Alphaproteobacteria bacterium]